VERLAYHEQLHLLARAIRAPLRPNFGYFDYSGAEVGIAVGLPPPLAVGRGTASEHDKQLLVHLDTVLLPRERRPEGGFGASRRTWAVVSIHGCRPRLRPDSQ
jgi:hypothetical protein